MYRCDECNEAVGSRISLVRVVSETRLKHYPARPKVNRVVKRGKRVDVDDPGGEGWEIARERHLCPTCFARGR